MGRFRAGAEEPLCRPPLLLLLFEEEDDPGFGLGEAGPSGASSVNPKTSAAAAAFLSEVCRGVVSVAESE